MALIVGLGNPGPEYEGTRHNIGFELIDKLAEKLTITLEKSNGLFYMGQGHFKSTPVTLIKPMTYMNRSGRAVSRALAMIKEEPRDCLICYDDINLDMGVIRLRPAGSAGGHNGLQDIIERLGTREVPRLRIGIGRDFGRGQQVKYVLDPFTPDQRIEADQALERACEAVLTYLRAGIEITMNQFNS